MSEHSPELAATSHLESVHLLDQISLSKLETNLNDSVIFSLVPDETFLNNRMPPI